MKIYNDEKRTNPRISRKLQSCVHCGYSFSPDKAKCPSCQQWNVPRAPQISDDETILLEDADEEEIERLQTGPWDVCFGPGPAALERGEIQGIARCSVTLLGGSPGAGKTTTSLQLADSILRATDGEVLYVAAEQASGELKGYGKRMGLKTMRRIRVHPMGASTDLGNVILSRRPVAVIVDSLPGLVADPEAGVAFCARFKPYAIELRSPVIIIDHVTKDADFAGLMKLQHAVDTLITLYPMEDEVREMSVMKNRFGQANFTKLLQMTERGLVDYESEQEDEAEDE